MTPFSDPYFCTPLLKMSLPLYIFLTPRQPFFTIYFLGERYTKFTPLFLEKNTLFWGPFTTSLRPETSLFRTPRESAGPPRGGVPPPFFHFLTRTPAQKQPEVPKPL